MIDFKKIDFKKIVTPFNFVLLGIIIVIAYAGYVGLKNKSTVSKIKEVAPGHVVKLAENPADLKVTLFYDYQCPFCYQIDPIVRQAAKNDGGVELLFKFLPYFGEKSEQMARMAYAAGQQDKFLEVHDYFLQSGNRTYDDEEIKIMSDELGLDFEKFKVDMDSNAAKAKIEENKDLAFRLNVIATPTLYIGDEFFIPEGKMPDVSKFEELFDQARQRL